MTGTRLEVETHIVTAGSPTIRNLEKALSQVGVDVEGMVFSGYSSSLAVLSDTEKELGVILVDIGAGTTDISIWIDGSVAYSSVLPIGARHITNDLAIGLRISLESAEKVKLFLSRPPKKIVKFEEESSETRERRPADEVDLSDLGLPEALNRVSQKTLVDGIIRPRLNEIFTMVGLEIKKSGFGGQTPSGLVITGGGARTVGAVESAKRMLAMPVRIGEPQNIKGIIDEIQDTPYSTVVGLSIYGALLGVESTRSIKFSMPGGLSVPSLRLGGNLGKRITDLIKSFIP
jgi:cell division protein FtsA